MLLDEELDIKITSKNIQHYSSLGYKCKINQLLKIKTSELSPTSKKIEKRTCDCCGSIYTRQHNFNVVTFKSWEQDVCPECLKSSEFKKKKAEKVKATNLIVYGTVAPLQNSTVHNKQITTMIERHGVPYPALSKEILEKVKETNNKRYGGSNPMSSPQVVEKVRQSLYENNLVPTSSQQKELFEMVKTLFPDNFASLNYPESKMSLDIYLSLDENMKIDIEYDGSHWHKDDQKDRRRDEFLKSKGYKILRIKSGHLLPNINELSDSIHSLLNSDTMFTEIVLKDWKK